MTIERFDADLKEALKSRDETKVSVIRMIKASLKNRAIEKMAALTDDDIISVLSSMAKQRKESIEQFSLAGRSDLAEKERIELEVLKAYLPAQLSVEEVDDIIAAVIKECGAHGASEMGKIMKAVMPRLKGVADGRIVSDRVKALLSQGV